MSAAGSSAWKPTTQERRDSVTATAAAALHGLLDAPGRPPAPGEPLPPLWHWLAFLPDAPQRELGSDGHPRLGSFLPPSRLPRRMYAGSDPPSKTEWIAWSIEVFPEPFWPWKIAI